MTELKLCISWKYECMDLIYGINSSQDRVLSSVIFTLFQLFYFPGYNANILRSGNIETIF